MRRLAAFFTAALVAILVAGVVQAQPKYSHDLALQGIELDFPGKPGVPTQVYQLQPGMPVTVKVTVRNNGYSLSVPYDLIVSAGSETLGRIKGRPISPYRDAVHTLQWVALPNTTSIEAQLVFTPPGDPRARGSYDVQSNNQHDIAIAVVGSGSGSGGGGGATGGSGPDLVIDSVSVKALEWKAGYHILVYVGNKGSQDVKGSFKVQVQEGGHTRSASISGLRAGESKAITIEVSSPPARVMVTVDPENRVKESNESNNRQ
ncbi:MAG: hypothetical protein HY319_27415 [Armatimonadetes bacterium]|nr:hypothetical protein [Armatimonadota bacterium]